MPSLIELSNYLESTKSRARRDGAGKGRRKTRIARRSRPASAEREPAAAQPPSPQPQAAQTQSSADPTAIPAPIARRYPPDFTTSRAPVTAVATAMEGTDLSVGDRIP